MQIEEQQIQEQEQELLISRRIDSLDLANMYITHKYED